MVKTIREVARETAQELGQAFIKSRKFLRKKARVMPRVSGQAPLAFAVVPPQYYQPVQKPRPVRRKMKKSRR